MIILLRIITNLFIQSLTMTSVNIFFTSLNFSVQSVYVYDQTQHTTSIQVLSMTCKALFNESYTAQILSVGVAGTAWIQGASIKKPTGM